MDLRPIFRPSFWFDMTPVAMGPFFERFFFVFFALFIIAGAATRIVLKNKEHDKYERIVLERLARLLLTYGSTGYIIYFFTFEEVQFFGSRFWYLVWAIALVVSAVRLVRYVKKEVPLLRHRDQSRVEANKYMPRSNRR